MDTAEPRWWAVRAVEMATWLLPPGPVRTRYRHELEAEQWGMTQRQQAAQAWSVLVGAPALHRALLESGVLTEPHSPLWCRLHLHHRWRRANTTDGGPYRHCRACGMDDDGTGSASLSGEGFGMTGVHPN